jgi:hypothetical protein
MCKNQCKLDVNVEEWNAGILEYWKNDILNLCIWYLQFVNLQPDIIRMKRVTPVVNRG